MNERKPATTSATCSVDLCPTTTSKVSELPKSEEPEADSSHESVDNNDAGCNSHVITMDAIFTNADNASKNVVLPDFTYGQNPVATSKWRDGSLQSSSFR